MEKETFLGKTFDDFLLRPRMGVVDSRREIDLELPCTPGISLALPVVSANMDSVTESAMARALALGGGLGVIHRGMSIQRQSHEVERVKRIHGFSVENPLCLNQTATIRKAREFMRRHNITGILIEEENGSRVLVGLLSNRDIPWMDGYEDRKVGDFMTPLSRLHTRPLGVSVEEAEEVMFDKRVEKLPLVDEKGKIQGLITRKDLIFFRKRPSASKDEKGRLRVGAAVGARGDYIERTAELLKAGADVIVIDIAHGHSDVMAGAIENIRKHFGGLELICGNVATAEGASFLKNLEVDGVKVGVGPGFGCRTRLETAAGVPQLQAIYEVWSVLRDKIPIIADGGIKHDKDIFLALVCGASSVMLGSMLSGTDESPGYVIEDPGTHQKRKIYRGMTSPQAVLETLYQAEPDASLLALETPPEGQERQVPYRGSVVDILLRIQGHLRSAVSYSGFKSLLETRQQVLDDPSQYLIPLSESSRRESYDR